MALLEIIIEWALRPAPWVTSLCSWSLLHIPRQLLPALLYLPHPCGRAPATFVRPAQHKEKEPRETRFTPMWPCRGFQSDTIASFTVTTALLCRNPRLRHGQMDVNVLSFVSFFARAKKVTRRAGAGARVPLRTRRALDRRLAQRRTHSKLNRGSKSGFKAIAWRAPNAAL